MIKPICDICGKELEDFGALLFSPDCKKCYNKLKEEYNLK